jgi:nucleoside-diphosphate-sugar epimerase
LDTTEIRHILFISSTSVFPNQDRVFKEEDSFTPDSEAGRQLFQAESLIMKPDGERSNTILRLGGLIGPDRHPVKFLSGKTRLPGGSDRINLIHRDDCTGLISAIISRNAWGYTFHGVAPAHPSKSDYYTAMATALNIPAPRYTETGLVVSGKEISGSTTARILEYQYQHPNLDI